MVTLVLTPPRMRQCSSIAVPSMGIMNVGEHPCPASVMTEAQHWSRRPRYVSGGTLSDGQVPYPSIQSAYPGFASSGRFR